MPDLAQRLTVILADRYRVERPRHGAARAGRIVAGVAPHPASLASRAPGAVAAEARPAEAYVRLDDPDVAWLIDRHEYGARETRGTRSEGTRPG